MEWSNETVLEFLRLYEAEPSIWNPHHSSHKDRSETSEAWKRIQRAISIQCTTNDLKKKKDSLMACFRTILNKMKRSAELGTEADEIYQPSWFAFPTMNRFLRAVYQPRSAANVQTGVYQPKSPTETEECQPRSTTDTEDIELETKPNIAEKDNWLCDGSENTEPSQSEFYADYENSVNTSSRITANDFQPPVERNAVKRKASSDGFVMGNRPTESYASSEPGVTERDQMDDYDVYGDLLARKLRKLDERTREIVMNEIDNLIFRETIAQCRQF